MVVATSPLIQEIGLYKPITLPCGSHNNVSRAPDNLTPAQINDLIANAQRRLDDPHVQLQPQPGMPPPLPHNHLLANPFGAAAMGILQNIFGGGNGGH
jgi:hypothetical protein|tara:strand:- start:3033 stop:3326 length:294 start_codon:yes stop_codon:yes gene_type:complete